MKKRIEELKNYHCKIFIFKILAFLSFFVAKAFFPPLGLHSIIEPSIYNEVIFLLVFCYLVIEFCFFLIVYFIADFLDKPKEGTNAKKIVEANTIR